MKKRDNEKYEKMIEACENHDGEWNEDDKECHIEDAEERTAFEDYVCDHPRDEIPYGEIC